jgi:hypothetical protein
MLDGLRDVAQKVKTNEQERARLRARADALLTAGRKVDLGLDELAHDIGLSINAVFRRTGKHGSRNGSLPKTTSVAIVARQTKIKEQLQALSIQIEENRRQGELLKSEATELILERLRDLGQRIKANEQERATLSAKANALLADGREAQLTLEALAHEMGVTRQSIFQRTGGKGGIRGTSHPKEESAAIRAEQTKITEHLRALRIHMDANRREGKLLQIEAKQLIGTAYDLGVTCRQAGAAMGISNVAVYDRGGKRGLKLGRWPS